MAQANLTFENETAYAKLLLSGVFWLNDQTAMKLVEEFVECPTLFVFQAFKLFDQLKIASLRTIYIKEKSIVNFKDVPKNFTGIIQFLEFAPQPDEHQFGDDKAKFKKYQQFLASLDITPNDIDKCIYAPQCQNGLIQFATE